MEQPLIVNTEDMLVAVIFNTVRLKLKQIALIRCRDKMWSTKMCESGKVSWAINSGIIPGLLPGVELWQETADDS